MSSDTKSEPELKDQPSPDNAKQASKKRKPGAGGTHRRTKTGCLSKFTKNLVVIFAQFPKVLHTFLSTI